nr:preprotein translocase subunit SecY [Cryptomonas sp. NIES-345]BDA98457.1 preprotein translocase subunit SecY [Cryptomonas sp. NIES-1327]
MQKTNRKKQPNELQRRITLTLALIILSRFGMFVPLPGIDYEAFYQINYENPLLNFLTVFSGNRLMSIGVLALGIVPYINASIVIQLGTNAIPFLEKLQTEEGEFGRQKIIEFTRYISLMWAIIQSLGISLWIRPYVFDWGFTFAVECTLALTAGSMLVMWISEQITAKGIGNGPSLLIFVNIVSGLPKLIKQEPIATNSGSNLFEFIFILLVFLLMIVGIIFVQEGTRQIPIISAKQLSKGQAETKTSYLPLKLNQGGVMPIIFASAFLVLPSYLSQITTSEVLLNLIKLFSPASPYKSVYLMFYFLLILLFSYFYSSLVTKPEEISRNLRKMESSIPGIRPGKDTTNYLQKTLNRLTFLGAVFLASIAVIPAIIENTLGLTTFKGLGSTSLLILVGVAIETSRQVQVYMISKNYEDIIN